MRNRRLHYRTFFSDSARWNDFAFRPGDVVISTPPKCGTTWMQRICALLVFQKPGLDQPIAQISPWLDMLLQPKAEVFAQLTAQTHRRFIKTHTPLDGLPIEDQVTYLCVGRDPRDAAVSMFNHRENMDHEAFLAALHKVIEAEGLETPQISAPPPLSLEASFWNWVADPTPVTQSLSSLRFNLHHAEVALRARARSNVVVMHYGDLKRDCEAEMRGLAKRLGIEVPEPIWPDLVQEASFERMRARAADVAPNSGLNIWKETRQFFHSGSGGHWHAFFDDGARHRYEARVTELSSPEVAAWVHSGWRGTTP